MARKPGLPKKYAKMGFKRGWAAYKASKRRSSKRSSKRKKTKRPRLKRTSRVRRSSTKSGRSTRRGTFNTQKILGLIPKAALLAPMAMTALDKSKPLYQKISDFTANYSGVQMATGQFRWDAVSKSLAPYAMAKVLQTGIPKLTSLISGLI